MIFSYLKTRFGTWSSGQVRGFEGSDSRSDLCAARQEIRCDLEIRRVKVKEFTKVTYALLHQSRWAFLGTSSKIEISSMPMS